MMHEHEKSDAAIGAEKLANKVERSAAELVEQRAAAKGNATSKARAGRGTGKACNRHWSAYDKPHGK